MNLRAALAKGQHDGYVMTRRLWFMGKPMPVRQVVITSDAYPKEIKGMEDFDFGERRWDMIVLSYVGGREMTDVLQRALDLLRRMKAGEFPDGAHVLRARIAAFTRASVPRSRLEVASSSSSSAG